MAGALCCSAVMLIRRILASVLAFSALLPMGLDALRHQSLSGGPPLLIGLLLVGGTVFAAGAVHARSFQLVLVGRALLWCYLVWVAFVSVISEGPIEIEIAWWGIATGLALLALRHDRVDSPSGQFAPRAFHGTLVAVLTMAIADAFALGFWSVVAVYEEDFVAGGALVVASLVMTVAVLGLLRLRTWAYLLNIGANTVIALGAWWVPGLPDEIALCLTLTAVGQLIAGAPVLIAAARGGVRRETGDSFNRNHVVSLLLVGSLIAIIFVDLLFAPHVGCMH